MSAAAAACPANFADSAAVIASMSFDLIMFASIPAPSLPSAVVDPENPLASARLTASRSRPVPALMSIASCKDFCDRATSLVAVTKDWKAGRSWSSATPVSRANASIVASIGPT